MTFIHPKRRDPLMLPEVACQRAVQITSTGPNDIMRWEELLSQDEMDPLRHALAAAKRHRPLSASIGSPELMVSKEMASAG